MAKIKVNTEVRELLVELDSAFQIFHGIVGKLSEGNLSDSVSGDLGAEKIYAERLILGIAWKINQASTGVKDL